MNVALYAVLAFSMTGPSSATDLDRSKECVVLLHGMARTERSMVPMEKALTAAGYAVANVGYPSREHPIALLAPLAVDEGVAECRRLRPDGPIHFVTHSLGGILLRYYTNEQRLDDLGRVVMLGPPNNGSAAADKWRLLPGFDFINGPAGSELGKGDDSVPLKLGAPTFEFAVIAGDRSIDPVTYVMLDKPNDGRVTVDDTKLDGMSDFRQVHASHAFMMRDREVIELTLAFLANGRFPDEIQ
ncbi:esterase/lipase family protein [Woeseia oceani]|nr:alpha/beta hydrolase [Woeseia oceani]